MEANLSLRDILTSVSNKSNDLNEKFREPLSEFIKKFNSNNTKKKVNLIFFGNVSVGKTTLINLFIRHLITKRTNKVYTVQTFRNKSAPTTSKFKKDDLENEDEFEEEEEEEEEDEKFDGFIELCTKEIENTYFVCLIENSESEAYEIILEVNDENDKQVLMKKKLFNKKKFDNKNQIIFSFSNTEDGVKNMNKFLSAIDHECLPLLKSRRENDYDKDKKFEEDFTPSKIIIKAPNFPEEYRLIDSPGLSIATFRKGFIKMINDLDYINYFLIVNDISAKESYSLTDAIVKEVSNDYGSPIIYSFFTKGEEFLSKFQKINEDYKSYVRINNFKIKEIDNMKEKMNFRKIIPINHKDYNKDVTNCLDLFFKDLDQITEEYGVANFEASVMLRLRKIICKINDTISQDILLSPQQISSLKRSADMAELFYEESIRNYFKDFSDNFKKFKKNFPDMFNKLCNVYDKYENLNDHGVVRSNYIEKHVKLSFDDFQKIIFEKPQNLVTLAFDQIYEKVDEEIKNKIIKRLQAEGLLDENSRSISMGALLLSSALIGAGVISMITFVSLRALGYVVAEGLAYVTGSVIFPVIGWVAGGVLLIVSLSDCMGMWLRRNTREDITQALLKWLDNNKGKIIQDSLERFKDSKQRIIKMLSDCKVFVDWTENSLKECDKFKPNSKPFPNSNYKEEFLNILKTPKLKSFFKKVFNYKESEESDTE